MLRYKNWLNCNNLNYRERLNISIHRTFTKNGTCSLDLALKAILNIEYIKQFLPRLFQCTELWVWIHAHSLLLVYTRGISGLAELPKIQRLTKQLTTKGAVKQSNKWYNFK